MQTTDVNIKRKRKEYESTNKNMFYINAHSVFVRAGVQNKAKIKLRPTSSHASCAGQS